jgi:hypothetical protein
MKKMVVSVLMLVLLAATAAPVLAQEGPGGSGTFAVVGPITALDGTEVTVRVCRGNVLGKLWLDQSLTVATTVETRFLLQGGIPITLGDLELDQIVSVNGEVVDGVWTATRITVGADLVGGA